MRSAILALLLLLFAGPAMAWETTPCTADSGTDETDPAVSLSTASVLYWCSNTTDHSPFINVGRSGGVLIQLNPVNGGEIQVYACDAPAETHCVLQEFVDGNGTVQDTLTGAAGLNILPIPHGAQVYQVRFSTTPSGGYSRVSVRNIE